MVKYAYDASGNLTSFTDTLNKVATYQYDLPGRMTKFFNPSFPSAAVVTNVYDSLGRVKTQTNARGKLYQYFFSGYRTEELGPGNVSRTSYIDAHGNVLQSSTPEQWWTINTYDGQSRLVKTVLPEGNSVQYTYDDATCISAEKRCTHNPRTITTVAKSGSGLANLTQSFTYESAFNQVATALTPPSATMEMVSTPVSLHELSKLIALPRTIDSIRTFAICGLATCMSFDGLKTAGRSTRKSHAKVQCDIAQSTVIHLPDPASTKPTCRWSHTCAWSWCRCPAWS